MALSFFLFQGIPSGPTSSTPTDPGKIPPAVVCHCTLTQYTVFEANLCEILRSIPCAHLHIHTCQYTHTCTHARARAHTHTHTHTHTHMHACARMNCNYYCCNVQCTWHFPSVQQLDISEIECVQGKETTIVEQGVNTENLLDFDVSAIMIDYLYFNRQ